MENQFSLKELYDVKLKATYPIEVGNRKIEPGEIVMAFDKIQIANFYETVNSVAARGGFDNRGHVYWDSTKDVRISFNQGIFSQTQFALLSNAKIIEGNDLAITLTNRERLESDETGSFELKENPSGAVFVYEEESGEKISFTRNGKRITIDRPYINVIVDYEYTYMDNTVIFNIGQKLLNGFLTLEGRTKIKEDITGIVKTGIIQIPKLKIMSNLSMRLGKDAGPQMGGFNAVAIPVGSRGESTFMKVMILDDDIDSDI